MMAQLWSYGELDADSQSPRNTRRIHKKSPLLMTSTLSLSRLNM
jgi:hypothetical protein